MGLAMSADEMTVTVIGGGVIGLAVGKVFSSYLGKEKVCVLEKHAHFGMEQSGRSSEVLHAGLYYTGLKAKLCVEGNRLLREFCATYDVPLLHCGKLIVAMNEQEEKTLEQLLGQGQGNGVEGLRLLSADEVARKEPDVQARAALSSSTTGVIDTATYVQRLAILNRNVGTQLLLKHTVTDIFAKEEGFIISVATPSEKYSFSSRYVVNAAGLYADEIARMVHAENKYDIVPVKGEYAEFRCREGCAVSSNIYPVPWSFEHQGRTYYDLGIHLTPIMGGKTVRVGPAVSATLRKNDYIFEKKAVFFQEKIKSFFPRITVDDLKEGHVGILSEEKNNYDFIIEHDTRFPPCIHLVGMESPGLTASLAVANHVLNMFKEKKYY